MQRRTALIIIGGIGLLIVGAAAWYLGSPLFINRTIEEALPFEEPALVEGDMPESEGPAATMDMQETTPMMPEDSMKVTASSNEPTILRSGEIVGADAFHEGTGTASIIELPDGSHIVRLELFEVTNGPDLHLLLATGSDPTGRDDLGEYIDLGELKGNRGNQNYDIPAGVDLSQYHSVVVYCVPFHVVFAHAPLGSG